MTGYRLGVDFGTTTTVAVLTDPRGQVRPLLFDGSELLPSAVCMGLDGTLVTGRDAIHLARANPAGFEPNPKRRIDDGAVLLAGADVPVTDLIAAVLRRVAAEARAVDGGPAQVVLSHPSRWGARRCSVLTSAAEAAGWHGVRLVPEPIAAAGYFVEAAGGRVPVGDRVLVCDFGGGTFDASVVRRTATGFEVVADRGLPDTGGLDIDAAIVAHLGTVHAARDPERWARLVSPSGIEDTRAARALWDDVRTGKEMLSRTSATLIPVPHFDDALLGREELERLAAPVVSRTVAATQAVIRDADAVPATLAAVVLVGGAARLPLAATMLGRALGVMPTVVQRPDLAVAEGCLRAPTAPPPPIAAPPPPAPPIAATELPAPAPARRRSRWPLVAAAVLAVGLVTAAATLAVLRPWRETPPADPTRFVGVLSGASSSVAYSPDGARLATLAAEGVMLWDAATGEPIRTIGHRFGTGDGPQPEVAFSRDGARVAAGLSVWDATSGARITTVDDDGYHTAFSPNGDLVAVASGFSYNDGVRLQRVDSADAGHQLTGEYANRVAFSADGALVAAGVASGQGLTNPRCEVWNTQTRAMVHTVPACEAAKLVFSTAGHTLAVVRGDGVELWNVDTGSRLRTIAEAGVRAAAFSPDGTSLALVTDSGTQLWDHTTGARGGTIPTDPLTLSVAFHPDGHTLAAAAPDAVRLWDVPSA